MSARVSLATTLLLALLAAPGCQHDSTQQDAQSAAARSRYLLTEEPDGALTVLAARESLTTEGHLVLVGRIGGVPEPWTKGSATFVLADPSLAIEEDQDHAHACGEGCAFCNKKKESPLSGLAVVEFVDESDRVQTFDPRRAFDIDTNQLVVVRGRVRTNDLGHLILAADGLYVRR